MRGVLRDHARALRLSDAACFAAGPPAAPLGHHAVPRLCGMYYLASYRANICINLHTLMMAPSVLLPAQSLLPLPCLLDVVVVDVGGHDLLVEVRLADGLQLAGEDLLLHLVQVRARVLLLEEAVRAGGGVVAARHRGEAPEPLGVELSTDIREVLRCLEKAPAGPIVLPLQRGVDKVAVTLPHSGQLQTDSGMATSATVHIS